MVGVVGGEAVVDLPASPGEPAAVHRADGDLAVEGAEADEVLEDVGARQHAVDPRVVEGDEQPLEHRPAVDHRPRLAGHADHPPRRVVGGDDEQRPVGGQLLAPRAVGERLGDALGSLDAHRREGGVVGVVETRHDESPVRCSISLISLSVGMASAHISRPATIAPAALAYSTIRAGGQPASKPWTNAPPKASPAPSPHTTSTGRGGDDGALVGRGDEDAVAAELDDGDADAAAEQGVGRLVGIVGADGDAALGAVADGDRRRVDRARR